MTRSLCLLAVLLAGCGARTGLDVRPPAPEVERPVDVQTLECFEGLEPEPSPALSWGAACDREGALEGAGMVAVESDRLLGLSIRGVDLIHEFFDDAPRGDFLNASRAVAARGEWVIAGSVEVERLDGRFADEARVEIAVARRDGEVLSSFRFTTEFMSSASLQVVGNERGVFAYSASSGHGRVMEVFTSTGDRLGAIEGFRPFTDPDEQGYVAVASVATEHGIYWLDPCTGEMREAEESLRELHTEYFAFDGRLVYADRETSELVVEGATEVRRIPAGEPLDEGGITIFDRHPSGWVLLRVADSLHFIAIHVVTEERRDLHIDLPEGFRRYRPDLDFYLTGELRVTSSGGVVVPLRDDAVGYLFTSTDGATWERLGRPVGELYSSEGIEASGSFVHGTDTDAVELPEWAPAPDPGRIDGQSTQLIRADMTPIVVEQSPPYSMYLHSYHLSSDGGCLAVMPIGGGDILWVHTETDGRITFPMPDHAPIALSWIQGRDVVLD